MKKMLLAISLLLLSTHVFAANNWNYMICDGTDSAGYPVTLTAYSDSPYVTINGSSLKIVGKTRNGKGVVTENFIATTGVLVYDSLVPMDDIHLDIYQFNAVTQDLLAQAYLTCRFYGNSVKATVIGQQIFKSLTNTVSK